MLTRSLLIQLFGRDILDLLAIAGYEDESAIADAGPERLAEASGISLPVAQRIVAVVQELSGYLPITATGSEAGPRVEPTPAPEPGSAPPPLAGSATRSRSRAARGKAAMPRATADKKAAVPKETIPADIDDLSGEAGPDETGVDDPFVDDVGLVSWMGFSAQSSSGRRPFSVAERILDPAPLAAAPVTDAQDSSSALKSRDDAPAAPATAAPSIASTDAAAQAPAVPHTIPGSFWSFGAPAGRKERDGH